MTVTIRPASPGDAKQMCGLLNRIIEIGGSTAHRRPFDTARMMSHYIAPPENICSIVAESGVDVVGFQSLVWPSVGPGFETCPPGWSFIASFAHPDHAGRGVGRAMFAATLAAARDAGVRTIDARISTTNVSGLGYYAAMGFVDYGVHRGRTDSLGDPLDQIGKRFDIPKP